MGERIDHAAEATQLIDLALAAPPVSIEEALKHAVAHQRMTPEEAQDCIDAYQRTFYGQSAGDAA